VPDRRLCGPPQAGTVLPGRERGAGGQHSYRRLVKTADVALLVAALSASISLSTLSWNIIMFKRSGPSVTACLSMGTHGTGPEGVGTMTSSLSVDSWAKHQRFRDQQDQHFFLTATNSGRAAIWVSEVGLCSSKVATSLNVVVDHEIEAGIGFGPGLPFKLDAGQTVRWAIPLRGAGLLLFPEGQLLDTECVHGQLTLGNGVILQTKEGVRVGQLRAALSNAETA
jgi:hypothetical protein